MVVTAREEASKDHEIVQRKNDQLKAQLADTENLLKSQQEQLAELKHLMEQMNQERDDQANSTAPSSPGHTRFDSKEEHTGVPEGMQSASGAGDTTPSYPTSYTHLIQPVLRTDLAGFDDFTSLLRMSKNHAAGSRVSSGSYGNIGIGLGLASSTNQSPSSAAPSNGSTTSINTFATIGSSPATPTTPASTVSTGSTNNVNIIIPLKETRFYKRALAEDIEPTLRLDTAPGLSWLARRTVLNAMCEGTLVVEPMPNTSTSRVYVFACSLCGETRKDPTHIRTHRFRTSESDSAQRYPLCKYCLGRVRSSCDFLGFLRVLKDGHWRTDDKESERAAWEESVRLREQMFWSRIGGGVIPASHMHNTGHTHSREKSPRTSEDARNETETMQKLGEEADMTGAIIPKDVTPVPEMIKPDEAGNAAFLAQRKAKKQSSLGDDTAEGLWEAAQADAVLPDLDLPERTDVEQSDEEKKENANRDSTQSLSIYSDNGEKDTKRLSITIPGSLEQ
jgi:Rab guanine nucleotide exchange factor SEC2